MIITIDGATGVGKTTTARLLSNEISFSHLVGGVFFRSLTYKCIEKKITNVQDVINEANNISPIILKKNGFSRIMLDSVDVTDFLWSNEVDTHVSSISSLHEVRTIRRDWLIEYAKGKNIVADGRTLGTEVFPNAEKKFYLLCDLSARFGSEKVSRYQDKLFINRSKVRDKKDNATRSDKFKPAIDAFVIDVTQMSDVQVLDAILKKLK